MDQRRHVPVSKRSTSAILIVCPVVFCFLEFYFPIRPPLDFMILFPCNLHSNTVAELFILFCVFSRVCFSENDRKTASNRCNTHTHTRTQTQTLEQWQGGQLGIRLYRSNTAHQLPVDWVFTSNCFFTPPPPSPFSSKKN